MAKPLGEWISILAVAGVVIGGGSGIIAPIAQSSAISNRAGGTRRFDAVGHGEDRLSRCSTSRLQPDFGRISKIFVDYNR